MVRHLRYIPVLRNMTDDSVQIALDRAIAYEQWGRASAIADIILERKFPGRW